jgi:1,4-dihydroxy-6-naphthoate synthase
MKQISIAHSPDADDIFMYYAIKFGWINHHNTKFINTAKDIQTLNEHSLKGVYDICAISFALYPKISKQYALLKTAHSFGYGYGPKLIKKKSQTKQLKKYFSVALSGEHTTNALLFKLKYPNAKIIYMNFLDIENAILSGKVDSGVLIHESILNYDNSLEVECEIFDIWLDICKNDLPLPLGGMAIRRSIPLLSAIEYENILIKAVSVATKQKTLMSKMLIERDLVRVDSNTLSIYLDMYANNNSIVFDNSQIQALNILYKLGFDNKLFTNLIDIRDYMIPSEYDKLRNES